ncbi:hypothetical protein IAU59_002308 [Kwoniella sp. CBS 9459]
MSGTDGAAKLGERSESPSTTTTRTTGRTRVKSQRVLEAEDTKRFLRNQAEASKEAATSDQKKPASSSSSSAKSKAKGKGKKHKEEETYCICKTNADGPMIECDQCNDWFHFSCIGMTDDEAEKIQTYVCPGCESSTGEKSTHTQDIQTLPSPSPPPDTVPAKRKQPSKAEAPSPPATPDDRGDNFEPTNEASPRRISTGPSPAKRPRKPSIDTKRKSSLDIGPPTVTSTASVSDVPPMRTYVRGKLAPQFQKLFVAMDDETAGQFAAEVEEGMYRNFKEVVGGKETAGTRYKAQFYLLSSSLGRGLRADLAQSIRDGSLSPAAIATLASADLASEEQLAHIERVKQSVLEQTVRAKEELESVRIGRDGFEKVENTHEKEMKALAEQEGVARTEAEEMAKKATEPDEPVETKSPVIPDVPRFAPRRSESTDVVAASPLKETTFALSSAWGKDTAEVEMDEPTFSGDQNEVDLSDIVASDEVLDDILDDIVSEAKAGPTEIEIFEAKPIVWSGGIVNPANPSSHVPPMSVRVVCRTSPPDWSLLLPHERIEITGRVEIKNSLRFLSDSRLNPTKELIVVAFTLDPNASEEETATWEDMIEYHIGRERHALYLPYGSAGRGIVPPGAAREVYMIPLRPSDPSPDFTDLIDGYSLPSTGRTSSVFLGVFVCNKGASQPRPIHTASKPNLAVSAPVPPPPPAPLPTTTMPAAPPIIQNEQLAALMMSLNPTALQGVLGGYTPTQQGGLSPVSGFAGTVQTPPQGGTTPMPPPQACPPYPPQEYMPHQPQERYTPLAPYHSQPQNDWQAPRPRDPRRERGRR